MGTGPETRDVCARGVWPVAPPDGHPHGGLLVLSWTGREVCEEKTSKQLLLGNLFFAKEFRSLFAFNIWKKPKEGTQTQRDRQTNTWADRPVSRAEECMKGWGIWAKRAQLMDLVLFPFIPLLHWCPLPPAPAPRRFVYDPGSHHVFLLSPVVQNELCSSCLAEPAYPGWSHRPHEPFLHPVVYWWPLKDKFSYFKELCQC